MGAASSLAPKIGPLGLSPKKVRGWGRAGLRSGYRIAACVPLRLGSAGPVHGRQWGMGAVRKAGSARRLSTAIGSKAALNGWQAATGSLAAAGMRREQQVAAGGAVQAFGARRGMARFCRDDATRVASATDAAGGAAGGTRTGEISPDNCSNGRAAASPQFVAPTSATPCTPPLHRLVLPLTCAAPLYTDLVCADW